MPIPCHTFAQTCLFSDDRPFLPDGLTAFTFSILMVWRVHLRRLVPRTFLVVMYSGPLMLFARSGAFPLAGPSIPSRVRVFDISRPRAGHQFSSSNSNESVAICSCLRFTSSRSSFSHCIRTVGPGGGVSVWLRPTVRVLFGTTTLGRYVVSPTVSSASNLPSPTTT